MCVFSHFRENDAYTFAPKVLTTTQDGEYENQSEQDQYWWKRKWKTNEIARHLAEVKVSRGIQF